MNTANLQLEGLYLAIAAINGALVRKGALTAAEVDDALTVAKTAAERGGQKSISAANHDAVTFPIRLLQHANSTGSGATMPSFSDLTRMVGELAHRG